MRNVVLTGAQGPLAGAIRGRLRRLDVQVKSFQRGERLEEALEAADVVVVLDAARVQASAGDYTIALRALAEGLRRQSVGRVVGVTVLPVDRTQRKTFLKEAEDAERALRSAGVALTVVRAGVVIGSPEHDGLADPAAIVEKGTIWSPGEGDARLRPILVDDVAAIVVATVARAHPADLVVAAEGPDRMTVDEMLQCLNGDDRRIRHVPPWLHVALLVGGAITAPALLLLRRMIRAPRFLPTKDLDVPGEVRAEHLGLTTKRLTAVWTAEDRERRRERERGKKSMRQYQSPQLSELAALFLVLSGLAAVAVGIHDIASISSLGARLAGGAMLVAGAIMLLGGSALLVPRWNVRYEIAFLGALALVLTLVALIVSALINRDPPDYVIAYVYLLVIAGYVLARLRRRGGVKVADLVVKRGPQAVSSLLAIGVLGALGQFMYSAVYVPATSTPTLVIDTKLEPGEPAGGRMPVTASITFTNTSKHPVNVLGTMFTIHATKTRAAAPEKGTDPGEELAAKAEDVASRARARAYAEEVAWRRIEGGTLIDPGTFAEPGERISERLVAFVPRGMDVAHLEVLVVVARRRFQTVVDHGTTVIREGAGDVVHQELEIDDPSWVHKLTRSTRYINVLRAYRNEPLPGCAGSSLGVFITSHRWERSLTDETGCGDHADHMVDHYGLTTAVGRTEVSLAR